MTVDWSKVGTKAAEHAEKHDDKGYGAEVIINGGDACLPEVDQDGNVLPGSYQLRSEVEKNKFGLVIKNSKIYGFTRNAQPATQPLATQSPDQMVQLWDKKGTWNNSATISVGEGKKDTNLEAILGDNNEVKAFMEKRRFRTGRR
jgi:hypothetical protein